MSGLEPEEQALGRRRRELTLIAEATPALISYVDADLRYRFVNSQYEAWFGTRREEILGRTVHEVLGDEALERLRPYVERVLAGEETRFELQVPYRSGGTRWIDAHYVPDRDRQGRVVGYIALVLDISQRKQVELSLARRVAEQTALYRFTDRLHHARSLDEVYPAALDSILDALGCDRASILLFDQAGVMRFVAWRGLSDGYRAAVEGHTPWQPGEQDPQPIAVGDVAAGDLPDELKRIVLAEGIRAFGFIPLVADERLIGKFMVYYDQPHEFPPAELELALAIGRQLAFGIERNRVEEERRRAEQALREADRRKDEFLATLAHELRNPLAPIRNALPLLELRLADGDDVSEVVQILSRQTDRLVRLVDDLMDVSRITRGHVELRQQAVDLVALVERAMQSVREQGDGAEWAVETAFPDDPVAVLGDAVRLEQVIANLLENAVKYTDRGGQIGVTVEATPAEARVRVRDSGIGIDPRFLERIFDVFAQADSSLDRSEGGLGIGLTVARRLVELHGGQIEARSEGLGRGSEFVVRLPRLPSMDLAPEIEPVARDETVAAPAVGARRVLVVDDNRDHTDVMADLIRQLGHEAHVALDGPAALALAREVRPHMVLLDIGLPGMSGYEVARRLREDPENSAILLVALTGYGQPSDRELSARAGFDAHVVKPIEVDALSRMLISGPSATELSPASGMRASARPAG